MTVNSKEENSEDFCLEFVQEIGLCTSMNFHCFLQYYSRLSGKHFFCIFVKEIRLKYGVKGYLSARLQKSLSNIYTSYFGQEEILLPEKENKNTLFAFNSAYNL